MSASATKWLSALVLGLAALLTAAPAVSQAAPADEMTEPPAAAHELARVYERLFDRVPVADRTGLLVEMLESEHTPVVEAAIALATRLLLDAEPVEEAVTQATIAQLQHPAAGVRSASVRLLAVLDPAQAVAPVMSVFEEEDSPDAAAAQMVFLAAVGDNGEPTGPRGAPMRALTQAGTKWLGSPEPASSAAAALLVSWWDRMHVPVDSVDSWVDPDLIHVPLAPSHITLLDLLGHDELVAEHLRSERQDTAVRAAEVLAAEPAWLDRVVDAARERSALVPAAVDGLIRHRPEAESHALVAELTATLEQARAAEFCRIFAAALPPNELELVLLGIDDPERSLDLAGTLIDTETGEDQPHPLAQPARGPLVRLLMERALEAGHPHRALDIAEKLPLDRRTGPIAHDEVIALVQLGRFDDAAARSRQAEVRWTAWRRAAQTLEPLPAEAVAQAFRVAYDLSTLPDDALRWLDALAPPVTGEPLPPDA
ncbi:MAG: hypothetical protein AAGI30_11935 [Planctomycetota bacterium]